MEKQKWSSPVLVEMEIIDTESLLDADLLATEEENFAYLAS